MQRECTVCSSMDVQYVKRAYPTHMPTRKICSLTATATASISAAIANAITATAAIIADVIAATAGACSAWCVHEKFIAVRFGKVKVFSSLSICLFLISTRNSVQ